MADSGVYLLASADGRRTYIGQSGRITRRWAEHLRHPRRAALRPVLALTGVRSLSARCRLERAWKRARRCARDPPLPGQWKAAALGRAVGRERAAGRLAAAGLALRLERLGTALGAELPAV